MSRLTTLQESWLVVSVGALLGGAIAYVCFTGGGRTLIRRTDAALDEAIGQMQRLQKTVAKVKSAIDEGRHTMGAVEDLMGSGSRPEARGVTH